MADAYSPEPRTATELSQRKRDSTCHMCAGGGKLTTSWSFIYLGQLKRDVTIRRCVPCNGWGVEGAGGHR